MEALGYMPLVSVVMINWNKKDVLKQALGNLFFQAYPNYEVIIADNGSTDGAPEMIENNFPKVKLIRLSENAGIKGYNIAFKNSSGEFIVILDNDSFLEDGGMDKIVKKFQKYPKLGALGCKVYYYPSSKVHHWHPTERSEDLPEEGVSSPLFNGCLAAARRGVLEEVGFYPEEFFIYENERDLCTRIINAGYDVRYFTDISGFHMATENKNNNERLIFYSRRNLIWYAWKYLPIRFALWKTCIVFILSLFDALRTLRFVMYLRPLFAGIAGVPGVLKYRKPVKREYLEKILY